MWFWIMCMVLSEILHIEYADILLKVNDPKEIKKLMRNKNTMVPLCTLSILETFYVIGLIYYALKGHLEPVILLIISIMFLITKLRKSVLAYRIDAVISLVIIVMWILRMGKFF